MAVAQPFYERVGARADSPAAVGFALDAADAYIAKGLGTVAEVGNKYEDSERYAEQASEAHSIPLLLLVEWRQQP